MVAGRGDAVSLLAVYTLLLFAIPSRLTIGALGGAGSPALVLGLALGALWAIDRLDWQRRPQAGRLVRTALFLMAGCFLISYIVSQRRPIDPAERTTADLGLIALASWSGVLLFTHDCVPSRDRLIQLTRYVVLGGGLLGGLALVQFATGQPFVDRISIPGLTTNSTFSALGMRDGFNRPSATALHPIEFGAVVTTILPLALALALTDVRRSAARRWLPVFLMVPAVLVSVSRSSVLGAVVGVAVLAATLPAKVVARLAAGALGFAVMAFLTVPGLLGTMLGLFTNTEDDPSIASRTGSYSVALDFLDRAPLFGRGFGTFLPTYRIFDNQFVLSSVEVGLAGVTSIVLLFAAAFLVGQRTRRQATDPTLSLLGQGFAASATVGALGLGIYDGFSFPMGTGTLFLLLGMAGAAHRLRRDYSAPDAGGGESEPAETSQAWRGSRMRDSRQSEGTR